jgi:lipoprotein-releasing system permease protein
MRVEFWLARRFLFNPGRFQTAHYIALASALAFMAVAAAMVIALSGFNGLRDLVLQGYRWTDPDLIIQASDGKPFGQDALPWAELRSMEGIRGLYAALESDALAVKSSEFSVVRLRGVDSSYYYLNKDLPLVFGSLPVNGDQVLVGINLAEKLGLSSSEPERLILYYPGRLGRTLFAADAFLSRSMTVSGSFLMHQEANARLILAPLDAVRELFGTDSLSISSVGIVLADRASEKRLKNKIQHLLPPGFKILNRMEQHKDVYKVLRIEKLAVFIVLGFIAIIASFILFGAASLVMLEKQRSAAVLAALGCSLPRLRLVFSLWILMVAGMGIILGLLVGTLLIVWQKTSPFFMLSSDDQRPFPVSWEGSDLLYISLFLILLAQATAVLRLIRYNPELKFFQTFKT